MTQETKSGSQWAMRLLSDNPALVVSSLYVIASLIGLVYSWAFLRGFEINVFEYAEISDFLLASLKEPLTWALAVVSILLVMADNRMSRRYAAKNPDSVFSWYGSERYRHINYLMSLLMVVFFLVLYASVQERDVRAGDGNFVTVQLADDSPARHLIMLGTTGKFLFLFDYETERVDIHPHENVLTISKIAPGPRLEKKIEP